MKTKNLYVDCPICHKKHSPIGYGIAHTCPYCWTVSDYSKQLHTRNLTLICNEINKINADRKANKEELFQPMDNHRDMDILVNAIQLLGLEPDDYLNEVLESF